ncbi:hypothetical protein MMAD_37750 [Mycolicibacterium madagascariense]|uniref:Uncharacterized protein n=1 Tax=Mycolicibacterium madagascariense TaxID=212765 RepID=A0A7I7XJV0_9MYCO|nr:hypothetical protein [Mycolicibacterium madagascariense]MCV7012946.1 hypothetical protein [Mycolicibacterium madagascariense]BBZ29480.1 hypothetical protein MMAD_37750 [Mycolicibacterium madagascariense]
MSDPEVYASEVFDGDSRSKAIVALTPIRAGDLTAEHVGRQLGFHDARIQANIPGEIKRVEHHDGPKPSVSIWFRYLAPVLGSSKRDDYMRVAPWFELQLVETLKA